MFKTFDSQSRDARTRDSGGAFLMGELERLDATLHTPLVNITWARDVDVREDVTLADVSSSFANVTFASAGGTKPTGKAWIGTTTNAITGIQVDTKKVVNPLNEWGMELAYTIFELQSSIKVNRPLDITKYDGLKTKYQMDLDEQVYVGDAELGQFGLLNSPLVTATNAVSGVGGVTWALKTPAEILKDVNAVLNSAWLASGYSIVPSKILLPPAQYNALVSQANGLNGMTGFSSIMDFLKKNSIASQMNGRDLEIQPVKWLSGRGVSGTDRMIAYTQDRSRVRIPMTPLMNTPIQYKGIHYLTYYYGKVGVVEITNTELMAYVDGI